MVYKGDSELPVAIAVGAGPPALGAIVGDAGALGGSSWGSAAT